MSIIELLRLLPLLILSGAIVGILLLCAFARNHRLILGSTLLSLVFSFLSLLVTLRSSGRVTSLLILDSYSVVFIGMFLICAGFVVALSSTYFSRMKYNEEYYVLLLTATLGAAILAASDHFTSFFLGLEILSISLYALISGPREDGNNLEAGLKYLVLAGVSSGILLFGMALLYDSTGTLAFERVASSLAFQAKGPVVYVGSAMILVGIGFKLALAPFHLWAPDVYEGSPAPVTAYIATVSKGAVVAVLMRYLLVTDIRGDFPIFTVLTTLAIASMTIGNFLALLQTNLKRLLAYSSTAHLGYVLIALLARPSLGVSAVTFYLAMYFVTTLGAFGVLTMLSTPDKEADGIENYRGLFWRQPFLASVLLISMFSLAGIPLTGGFVGKFAIVRAGIQSNLWLLVITLAFNSALAVFYYLRVIVMLLVADTSQSVSGSRVILPLSGFALAMLTVLVVGLGVCPGPVFGAIQAALDAWHS